MQKLKSKIALVILSAKIKKKCSFLFHVLVKERKQRECEIKGEKTNTLSKITECKEPRTDL